MVAPERRAALILGAIALVEGIWVALNFATHPAGFARFLGFAPGRIGSAGGWALALLIAIAFVAISVRLPSVRATLLRASWLKALAVVLALVSGILEEAVFRKLLMDWLAHEAAGNTVQVAASAIAFGGAHAVWGLMAKSFRAAAGATVATGVLGLALALVYLVAGRSVVPCIAAHCAINLLVEPGLTLAAYRGEMGAAN